MHFIDEAKIYLKAGDGGNGISSFRREKYIEYGGPDGGNGGRGGDVVLRIKQDLNTLIDFRYRQHFTSENGKKGGNKEKTGAAGKDMMIELPVGTQIFDETGTILLKDLDSHDSSFTIAKGGRGGLGNSAFKSSINRSPRKCTNGELGDEIWVWLKLKLLSDVGLVGMPNAGKSTFLSTVSNAKPKIADYPFTTLKPQLGITRRHGKEIVIADIPGLIEGASQNKGLGIRFLKHIERCSTILHIVDICDDDIVATYISIRKELEEYNKSIIGKPEVIMLSKSDTIDDEDIIADQIRLLRQVTDNEIICATSKENKNIDLVLDKLFEMHSMRSTVDIEEDDTPTSHSLSQM